jgi:hypothetical protein
MPRKSDQGGKDQTLAALLKENNLLRKQLQEEIAIGQETTLEGAGGRSQIPEYADKVWGRFIAAVWRMKGRNPEEVDTLTIVAGILRDFALLYPSGPLTVREGRARELARLRLQDVRMLCLSNLRGRVYVLETIELALEGGASEGVWRIFEKTPMAEEKNSGN